MGEKELFNFGDKELNVNSLLKNINSNLQSYLNYYSSSIQDSDAFVEKVNYIAEGIKNGSITTDGTGVYHDANGKLSKDDKLMSNALHYVDIIAKELSKKTRSLTQSEIDLNKRQQEEALAQQTAQLAAPQTQPVAPAVVTTPKKDFDPDRPFNFEYALKSQFGPSLEIPYNALLKSITRGADGAEDYSVVKQQFQKAFDSMRSYLGEYNNSEQYINQVNDLESVLFDGVWDHRDELAIHQVGLNKDLNNLKQLFTHKLAAYNPRQNYKQALDQVINPGDFTVIDGDLKSILYLDETGNPIRENITDEEYYKLSGTTPVNKDTNKDLNLDELGKDFEEDHLGWEVIAPIVADIYSIASPEPISATIAGLASDITGIVQDVRNGGDFHWGQHGFNIGATAFGIIPYIGDVGNVTKVGSKIVKASLSINKVLGSASSLLNKIPKAATKTAKYGTIGAGLTWAYLDLTDEDSILLELGQKALTAVENGEITAENIIAVGNALAVALQVRKGWKKFRNLDPAHVSTSSSAPSAPKPKPSFRDELTTRIKTNNSKISKKDLDAIQAALDKIPKEGRFTNLRLRSTKPSAEYLEAQKLLREKGHFSESEITEILKEIAKHAEGGVLKASNGMKTPWRLNFDGTIHQMDTIYDLFTQNALTYDAKQMAESFNKLNADTYKTLDFKGKDNTLGFKNWNTTFNESGLNNLFGYNEDRSDYLGVTTKSRQGFIDHLKNQGTIKTGNGNIAWNPTTKQWDYSDWVDPNVKADDATVTEPEETTGSESNTEAPKVKDLTLKDLNLRKPVDFNPHGIINSLAGYVANEVANEKKREIQKEIPLYQLVMAPEKAFRTAYTYDLEKAKGEVIAEAHSVQPVTSDVSTYYKAKNDAIKNAREYASKIDTAINDINHQVADANTQIAYENAVKRVENVNTNAKYRHDWEIEQKQGDVDHLEARNQSFQNLNKEIKHNVVTDARRRQKQRDAYVSKHVLIGVTTNPSNYINGWTKHHDLIWYKGQNGQLETEQEQIEYQQLLSIVNQAASTLFAQYESIKYPGLGTLHTSPELKEEYSPIKQGMVIEAAKGAKIDKNKIGKYINKLK